jgi:transposase
MILPAAWCIQTRSPRMQGPQLGSARDVCPYGAQTIRHVSPQQVGSALTIVQAASALLADSIRPVAEMPAALTSARTTLIFTSQVNTKGDYYEASGHLMQCGWYKEVRVKDLDSHAVKALLVSRALLVKIKRDVENQIRGLLKNLGLVIGRAKMNVFAVRAAELIQDRPELTAAVVPLLKTREVIERQIADLDRKVLRLARNDTQVRRFMTVPGVGPITALCYLATIDDPTRFKKSRSVGAYAGLTTRRYRSGEIVDWTHLEMWRCDVANLPI